jgi:small acid-soluble spore protein D (minor alpha/beta-type SASP)
MSRSNKPVNPAAQKALDRLKNETAAEIGLTNYENTYKGALTSADNGRVGGQMVKKMIQSQEQQFGGQQGQQQSGQTGQTLTQKNNLNK